MKRILVYGLSNQWGGLEAIVHSIIRNLEMDVHFDLLLSGGTIDERHLSHGENVSIIQITSWGHSCQRFRNDLTHVFHEKSYDFVWINSSAMSNRDIISVIKEHSDAKIITHSHGSNFEEANPIKRCILLLLHYLNRPYYIKNADYKFMCSKLSGEWFYGKSALKNETVHLIKNGIDLNKFVYDDGMRHRIRTAFGINDEIVLFHAGRLAGVKNQSFLVDIVDAAVAGGMSVRLLIAGNGELESQLKEKVRKLKLDDNILFLGARDDVNKIYQAADIFMLPSFHEGFPVTLTEAQAAGLPCLVSDKISEETNISGIVKYLSIDSRSIPMWIEAIKSSRISAEERERTCRRVKNAGFDITDVTMDFKSFLGI